MPVYALGDDVPEIHPTAFVHPDAAFGVLVQLGLGADDDLVHHLALVLGPQAHGFALAHLDVAWGKAHVVAHAQGDGAGHGLGVAGNAPFFLFLDRGRFGSMRHAFMTKTGCSAHE